MSGRRRWGLGVREELAMIKLIESKLCIVEVMVIVVRIGDDRVEGLLSWVVFSVFATVDDEIIAKIVGPVRAKTRGELQIH